MKKNELFLLIGIIIISVALQLFAAARMSFWEDEVFTSIFASRGIETIQQVQQWDVHPPLYLYLAAYWGSVFGFNEIGLRFLSILLSELALFLTFVFSASMFGVRTALFSVALLGFSPLFVMFGHQARYYSLTVFLGLSTVLVMWKHMTTRKWYYLLLYIISSILIVNVFFAGLVIVFICAFWWMLDWSRRQPRNLLEIISWVVANLAVLVGIIPVLNQLNNISARTPDAIVSDLGFADLVKRVAYSLYVYGLGETLSPMSPIAWIGAGALAWITFAAIRRNKQNSNIWLPVIFFLVILVSGVAATLQPLVSQTWQNLPVRALYGLPFLSMFLASGLESVNPRIQRVLSICLLAVFSFAIFNYFTGRQYLRPIFAVQWRTLFAQIAEQAEADALVVCGEGDSSCNYYSNLYQFGGNTYEDWPELSAGEYSEVWWIQNNLGRALSSKDEEARILDQLAHSFGAYSTMGYGEQDEDLRRIKVRFTGQDDYLYRAVVHHFYQP